MSLSPERCLLPWPGFCPSSPGRAWSSRRPCRQRMPPWKAPEGGCAGSATYQGDVYDMGLTVCFGTPQKMMDVMVDRLISSCYPWILFFFFKRHPSGGQATKMEYEWSTQNMIMGQHIRSSTGDLADHWYWVTCTWHMSSEIPCAPKVSRTFDVDQQQGWRCGLCFHQTVRLSQMGTALFALCVTTLLG